MAQMNGSGFSTTIALSVTTALEELIAAVADRPNIVMAGPKLLGWHDRTHLLEVGISIATNGSRWTGLEPHEYDQWSARWNS